MRENEKKAENEEIRESGSVTVTAGGGLLHCLTIIGQIEGHYTLSQQNKTTKYEHVIPQLVAIEESREIKGLLIVLNTVGGDVEAGLAIAELVAGMRKPTVSLVLGGGHSIGVPLAVSARRSFIVPSATMTIHPVRMNGLVVGIPQTFSYFERMQDRIIAFVTHNSHITADRMHALMLETGEMATDVGTVLDGEAAVREGLIDRLGGLSDALACLRDLIREQYGDETAECAAVPSAAPDKPGGDAAPDRAPAASCAECPCREDADAPPHNAEGQRPKPMPECPCREETGAAPAERGEGQRPKPMPEGCPFREGASNASAPAARDERPRRDSAADGGSRALPDTEPLPANAPDGKSPRWDGTPADRKGGGADA